MGPIGNGGTGGMGYRGMGHMGKRAQGVWGTRAMGHIGNGSHGEWCTWAMGYRGMGKWAMGPMGDLHPNIKKMSSCQKDVKLSKRCQMSNSQTSGLWRRFTKKINRHNEVHTY